MKVLNSSRPNRVKMKSGDQVIGVISEWKMSCPYEGGIAYEFYPMEPIEYVELGISLEDLDASED